MNTELTISLTATLVSVVSLAFTWFSLKYQREHNYKSVRPIAVISVGDYEDHLFVRIDNSGIGPLIIRKLIVTNGNDLKPDVIGIIPRELSTRIVWSNFVAGVEGKAIQNGDQLILLEYKSELNSTDEPQLKRELRSVLAKITVEVEYTDVYEKTVFKERRPLEWFARK